MVFSAGAYTISDKPLRLKTWSGHARLGNFQLAVTFNVAEMMK